MTDGRPLVIATVARERGITGVHTHVRQLREYLARTGGSAELVTPHSWAERSVWRKVLLMPLFGVRVALERLYGPANVWWYRTSHEFVLRQVLRRRLSGEEACTVYAQFPVSARAALAARSARTSGWCSPSTSASPRPTSGPTRARFAATVGSTAGSGRRNGKWSRMSTGWSSCPPGRGRPCRHGCQRLIGSPPPSSPTSSQRPMWPTGRRPGLAWSRSGTLEAVKNHRYLLRVLAAARHKGYVYSLDVFGEGVERARLVALAHELGVSDQVRLHGFCPDVQARLPGYQAYVHASYSESSSLAIMEAMAVGLPVISSRIGALGELFDDPEHGRFWPIDDAEDGARILIQLMESRDELERAGRAAKKKFQRDYDADVVAPRLLNFLEPPPVTR